MGIILLFNGCNRGAAGAAATDASASGELSFIVMGDWGRGGKFSQQDIADQMEKTAAQSKSAFVLSMGDNFYEDGVQSVNDPQWQSSFENIYTGEHLQKKWYVVLGNHDYRGDPQAEVEYTKKSNRWMMPDRYYTFVQKVDRKNSVRFVIIDSSPFYNTYHKEPGKYHTILEQDTLKQLHYIDSVLAQSTEKWKIVLGHHPVFSASDHEATPEFTKALKPILEKRKAQFYLSGHDHSLQHIQPATGGVDYVVSGSGSQATGKIVKQDIVKFGSSTPGFALMSIKGDTATTSYIDAKGSVLYSFKKSSH